MIKRHTMTSEKARELGEQYAELETAAEHIFMVFCVLDPNEIKYNIAGEDACASGVHRIELMENGQVLVTTSECCYGTTFYDNFTIQPEWFDMDDDELRQLAYDFNKSKLQEEEESERKKEEKRKQERRAQWEKLNAEFGKEA